MADRSEWLRLLRLGYGVEDIAVLTSDAVSEVRLMVRAMRANGGLKAMYKVAK